MSISRSLIQEKDSVTTVSLNSKLKKTLLLCELLSSGSNIPSDKTIMFHPFLSNPTQVGEESGKYVFGAGYDGKRLSENYSQSHGLSFLKMVENL